MTVPFYVEIFGPLRDALVERTTGLLLFWSTIIAEKSAMELVAASLATPIKPLISRRVQLHSRSVASC